MTELEVIEADATVEVVTVGGSLTTGISTPTAGTVEVVTGTDHITGTTPAPTTTIEPPSTTTAPVVTAGTQGPRGPQGEQGPVGPPGPGSGSAFYYVHSQMVAADTWRVVHDLGGRPAVTVTDSAGTVVIGDVAYLNDTELLITFTRPFGGYAYLS